MRFVTCLCVYFITAGCTNNLLAAPAHPDTLAKPDSSNKTDLNPNDLPGHWWTFGLGFQSNGGPATERLTGILRWEYRAHTQSTLSLPIEVQWWHQRRTSSGPPEIVSYQNPYSINIGPRVRFRLDNYLLGFQGGIGIGHEVGWGYLFHYAVLLEYPISPGIHASLEYRRLSYENSFPFFLLEISISQ